MGEQIEFYNNLYFICFVLGCVLLLSSIVSFFGFHICKIISDLTGRTERQAIMNIKSGKRRGRRETNKKQRMALESTPNSPLTIRNTTVLDGESSTTLKLKGQLTADALQEEGICLTTVLNEVEDQTVVLSDQKLLFEIIQEIIIVHTDEVIE